MLGHWGEDVTDSFGHDLGKRLARQHVGTVSFWQQGNTALMHAARNGQADCLAVLLVAGADKAGERASERERERNRGCVHSCTGTCFFSFVFACFD